MLADKYLRPPSTPVIALCWPFRLSGAILWQSRYESARISLRMKQTASTTGRQRRTVTLNWQACKALKSDFTIRPAIASPYVFLTTFKRSIGPRAIENVVTKHLNEARIHDASVHPLRHTFATHRVRPGTTLDTVRQTLGQSELKTTSVDVDLAREQMEEELLENAS